MMKQFFSILALLTAGVTAQAQTTLATFENPDADQLGNNDATWYDGGKFTAAPQVMDNPSKDAVNGSDKCYGATNVADADWWGNFCGLKLKEPVTIGSDNRFLSFKCYRSIQPKAFRIYMNADNFGSGPDESLTIFEDKVSEDDKWQQIVIDLGENHMGQTLSSFFFILSNNWDDPRSGWGEAVYAFDDFQLSATSGLEEQVFSGVLSDFENQTFGLLTFDNSTINADQFSQTPAVVSNPLKEAANSSDYCFGATNTAAVPQWWMNIAKLKLNNPTVIDETNRYLLMKVYRSAQSYNFRIGFNGYEENQAVFDGQIPQTGKWCLLVTDLGGKFMGSTLKELQIVYSDNWSGADDVEAAYCFDDIAIVSEAEMLQMVKQFNALNATETEGRLLKNVYLASGASLKIIPAPASTSNGWAVLQCPGGGYSYVVGSQEESGWAPLLNTLGITSVVITYRLPNGNPDLPVSDALAALKYMRDNAEALAIKTDQIGVMGFSAGGHLASTLATHTTGSERPAFQVLFYPVITMESSFAHLSSREQLLGSNPSQELIDLYSNEKQVTSQTPQAYVCWPDDDSLVPPANSEAYVAALKEAGVPVHTLELPYGDHGFGFGTWYEYHNTIIEDLCSWLNNIMAPVPSAINTLPSVNKQQSCYNLAGQRVSKLSSGVYVTDGKKVVASY